MISGQVFFCLVCLFVCLFGCLVFGGGEGREGFWNKNK